MSRALATLAAALAVLWFMAHILYVGPMETPESEVTLVWVLGIAAAALVVAAVLLLAIGPTLGPARPVWLTFGRVARNGAAMVGAVLVVVGLLHYRDTEPQGEIAWIVLGVVILAGSGLVHWWIMRARRKELT
jgi:hypothetical protein